MSEQQQNEPIFAMQRVYLKDASLEMPNAPKIFLENEAPNIEISLNLSNQALEQGVYEVAVRVTLKATIGDKTVYLVEAEQAGVFSIQNLPEGDLEPVLNIVCSGMLYPYLRANVADLITRASLPPLHLADVNFQALYEQRLAAEANNAEEENKEVLKS